MEWGLRDKLDKSEVRSREDFLRRFFEQSFSFIFCFDEWSWVIAESARDRVERDRSLAQVDGASFRRRNAIESRQVWTRFRRVIDKSDTIDWTLDEWRIMVAMSRVEFFTFVLLDWRIGCLPRRRRGRSEPRMCRHCHSGNMKGKHNDFLMACNWKFCLTIQYSRLWMIPTNSESWLLRW